jgi:hypothetical protein
MPLTLGQSCGQRHDVDAHPVGAREAPPRYAGLLERWSSRAQNIALKCRADFWRFSRIWVPETIRARAAKI